MEMEIEYNPHTGPTSITPTNNPHYGKSFYELRLGLFGQYNTHISMDVFWLITERSKNILEKTLMCYI